ncbi:uncharacterized protein BDR25DRAFT_48249 [Lindgomyces ingoldianus]|uniref:Uncharacterized protein n=1 Tax=Lindgomyces ingoldianus TaxID=673940 RepID=A0ACB6QS32_9PLEO|nr:uncharacterized protein BDR25DRAFT_48249 [Lindgomyces ingoldianus]KAF2469330.1 hypothetical protein BDR25DRAFT_48249 [Lindgomyces ingoldianus]
MQYQNQERPTGSLVQLNEALELQVIEMAPNGSKKIQVRKKTWKPKTRTGCVTCRIRRVKCDEAKPACDRCSSTGRRCDGYATPTPPLSHQVALPHQRSPLFVAPSEFQLGSIDEQQAFFFYRQHSAFELSGFFDSSFWQFEVLQAAHSNPAVRHAVVALAAMHRVFVVSHMPVVPDDASDKQLRFALQQCNRSIQEVIKSPARKTIADKINMMTCCILFDCLACIQGHQSIAFDHLRSGLKILKEVDDELAAGIQDGTAHPVSLSSLRTMFVDMDTQVRGVMSDDDLVSWEPQPKRDPIVHQTAFVAFSQAHSYLEAIFNDLLAFVQDMDVRPPTSDTQVQAARVEFRRLQSQYEAGNRLLEEFLSLHPATVSTESRIGVGLIQTQVRILLIAQKYCEERKEIDWDILEPEFQEILSLACELLGADPNCTLSSGAVPEEYYNFPADRASTLPTMFARPVFSSGSKLLSGLWLASTRSRNPTMRRKAIGLMLEYPRREGVWDSILAGRIAWELNMFEESALNGDLCEFPEQSARNFPQTSNIPECNRVRDVLITYTGLRRADVEFRSKKQYEEGERGILRRFAW